MAVSTIKKHPISRAVILNEKDVPTTATQYDCNWQDYDLLIISAKFYGNNLGSIVCTKDYFSTTVNTQRVLMYMANSSMAWDVYSGGNGKVIMKANASDSARGIEIVGIR